MKRRKFLSVTGQGVAAGAAIASGVVVAKDYDIIPVHFSGNDTTKRKWTFGDNNTSISGNADNTLTFREGDSHAIKWSDNKWVKAKES